METKHKEMTMEDNTKNIPNLNFDNKFFFFDYEKQMMNIIIMIITSVTIMVL